MCLFLPYCIGTSTSEPLRLRIITSTACYRPTDVSKNSRGGLYKRWTEDQMSNALSAVVRDGSTIARAAVEYGVPASTLGDRVRGRVMPGGKSGPTKYLSDAEEKELETFLLRCSNIGYPKTRHQVLAIVQRILDSKHIGKNVTDGWWSSFRKRHPDLSLRAPAPLSKSRAMASNIEVFEQYFDLLEQTINEYDLDTRPHLIYNMDETGLPLNPKPPKVIAGSSDRNPSFIGSGDKTQITVVGCVSASGVALPPMVIWDRKTLAPALADGEVGGTKYGLSDRGWMDSELFDGWFCKHFLQHSSDERPLMLLLDGHSSHFCPDTLRMAAKQDVVIFALSPNTTHLSQPLDKGCFGPFKTKWREVCHRYMSENPGKIVTRYSFSKLFAEAWNRSMTICNIMSGFATTGIFPPNRNAVLSKLALKNEVGEKPCSQGNLTYLPMSSPMPPPRKYQVSYPITFTEEELLKFQTRYENGFDLVTDDRYNKWLTATHPDEAASLLDISFTSSSPHADDSGDNTFEPISAKVADPPIDRVLLPMTKSSAIKQFLSTPRPPPRQPSKPHSSGRVLTSYENLQILKEKEQQKLEKEKLKLKQKQEREQKKKDKEEEKKERLRLKEEKENAKKRKQPKKKSTCAATLLSK